MAFEVLFYWTSFDIVMCSKHEKYQIHTMKLREKIDILNVEDGKNKINHSDAVSSGMKFKVKKENISESEYK